MSKKEKIPSTPEMRAQKLARSAEKRKIFGKTFEKAFGIMLALLLVYSVCSIAFKPATASVATNAGTQTSSSGSSGSSSSGSSSSGSASSSSSGSASSDNAASASSDNGSSAAQSDAAAPTELSASSSVEDVVNYFNKAINNVKPNAKEVTLTKETNSQAGNISGDLPKTLTSMADSLVSSNMGDKDLSSVSPATSVEDKNAMFPVENESWSSKLTADDIESKEVVDNGSSYVITLYIKADEPSTDTAHGNGHNGKIFSVIMPSIVTDNAGPAASVIKDVKTGHSDGYVKVTVDKASGNVTEATYYFVWTLSLTALSKNVSIPFGLEKDFTIAW
ncbi:MAG: hypothetical protein MR019_05130 [Ruminococcus sp.]|nr:hypothetical protein [Ruminococcus sp.]MDY3895695.1 hypothetical protein [Candidatus Fimenecus sp.]